MFKRNKKNDEKIKRQLEEELDITTYEEEQIASEDTVQETSDMSSEPDDGYPEIGPSYQPPEEEDFEEPVLPSDDVNEVPLKEDLEEPDNEELIEEQLEPIIEPEEEEELTTEEDEPNASELDKPEEEEDILPAGWQWADIDIEDSEEEPLQAPDFILEDIPEEEDSPMVQEFTLPTKDKVDLNQFFEASKEQKKLKRRDKKQYSRKELKRRKKRETRSRVPEDIRDQKVFLFRRKRYKTVEDFIKYLNDHYLDIDDVAREVLADENFFGFVGKKSGVFPQSLQEFREIKKKIEGNE